MLLKVTHTDYPCGKRVHYLSGMEPPEVKSLGEIMKDAAFEFVQPKKVKPQPKLKVA